MKCFSILFLKHNLVEIDISYFIFFLFSFQFFHSLNKGKTQIDELQGISNLCRKEHIRSKEYCYQLRTLTARNTSFTV